MSENMLKNVTKKTIKKASKGKTKETVKKEFKMNQLKDMRFKEKPKKEIKKSRK